MAAKRTHPLLIRGEQITEQMSAWRLKDHPHTVAGERRGFEVRVYHYPVQGWEPYLVTMTSIKEGWVFGTEFSPTEAAAESVALEMLSHLTPDDNNARRRAPSSEASQLVQAEADRVEHLTGALFAAIESSGASYPQAKHALTRALGALIGANAQHEADRVAALSVANRVVADCAESASLIAKYGHRLRPWKSRLN
jgi:hypothetical protein